ncbi:LOW QUALITY PROTEIN: putative plasmid stability protein StbE, addiction module antitoxin [Aggregatibacter actinomycetemcomitans ANH9381]|nr:LOW QUALITY PROTEIN: putative plasmid stability protein StbE, addiction module antitoxin [Aggregatibacter actinomycetemcomitans ANH9381]
MSYIIEFIPSSEKEFRKLDINLRKQFIEKLKERAENPSTIRQITRHERLLKIKLRNVGYHLVYQVIDERIVVKIIAVGKRDRNFVYTKAKSRL